MKLNYIILFLLLILSVVIFGQKISFKGKDYLENLQNSEAKRTGIPSLKITFNNVFGYYIEIIRMKFQNFSSRPIEK